MKIPKKIKLLNQIIEVKYDNDYCDAHGVLGQADSNHNLIVICSRYEGKSVPIEKQSQILCHELCHIILSMIGQKELYKDELLVDNLGTALFDLIENNNFSL